MGYKVLGFAVWQGGRWYLRRRLTSFSRKAAIAGAGALLVGGLLVAQRASSSE
jgi:hypothetical protein